MTTAEKPTTNAALDALAAESVKQIEVTRDVAKLIAPLDDKQARVVLEAVCRAMGYSVTKNRVAAPATPEPAPPKP